MAARYDSQSRIWILPARGRNHLDRKLPQVRLEGSGSDGPANRISLRRPVVRFRMGIRAKSFLRLVIFFCLVTGALRPLRHFSPLIGLSKSASRQVTTQVGLRTRGLKRCA